MIYPTLLVAVVMSAQGALFEHTTEYPNWDACQRAQRQLDKENKHAKVPYRNPYGKTYFVPRIKAFCRMK